jgi:hypothetical protein
MRYITLNDKEEAENFMKLTEKYLDYLIKNDVIPHWHKANLIFRVA